MLPRLKLLETYNLRGKLNRGVLTSLKGKCFTNFRFQLYNNEKSQVLDAERRERFREIILACDDDAVVTDLKRIKSDIITNGGTVDETVTYFKFFIRKCKSPVHVI